MIMHVLFPVAFRVHCRQQIVLVAVRAQNGPINEFKKHKTQCLADTAPLPSPPQLTTFISLLFSFFNFPSTTTCFVFPPTLPLHFSCFHSSFLSFSTVCSPPLLIFVFPPRFYYFPPFSFIVFLPLPPPPPPPPHFYCFSSTTTTFLLFFLHHHISLSFPAPTPDKFYGSSEGQNQAKKSKRK